MLSLCRTTPWLAQYKPSDGWHRLLDPITHSAGQSIIRAGGIGLGRSANGGIQPRRSVIGSSGCRCAVLATGWMQPRMGSGAHRRASPQPAISVSASLGSMVTGGPTVDRAGKLPQPRGMDGGAARRVYDTEAGL